MEHLHEPPAKLRICHIPAPRVMDLVQMAVGRGQKAVPGQMVGCVHLMAEHAAADTAGAHTAQPALFGAV